MFRALVKAWRTAMKWFAVVHYGYLCKRHPCDYYIISEKKCTELEKLSTFDSTDEGFCAIYDWLT